MVAEIVSIVDENDEVVGEDLKERCHVKGLRHRASSVFVFNSGGELLLQRRSKKKVICPNLLGGSASGHVDKGESYLSAARRELKEELGVEIELKEVCMFSYSADYPNGKKDRENCKLFSCVFDGDFKLQKEELSEVKFFSIDKIKRMIQENRKQFTPGFLEEFKCYLRKKR